MPKQNDYSLERGLPTAVDAERSILGSLLLDNALYDQASSLTDDDFSLAGHRVIFRRMGELARSNRPIDMITLSEELDRHKEVEAVGGVSYLSGLIDGVPERISIEHYVKIVHNKGLLRALIAISQNAIAEAIDYSDDTEEVLSRAEQAILQLSDCAVERQFSRLGDSITASGGIDSYLTRITDPLASGGIPTGYVELDRLTGGLKPTDLIIVAARPGCGKTSWALNVVENIVSKEPERVIAVFSLEMSQQALESRLLASVGRVDVHRALGGWLSLLDKQKLTEAIGELIDKQIHIDDSSNLNPLRLRSKCRQLKRRMGRLDLVIVDYLQLMSGAGRFENRQQEVSGISRALKALAKDLLCPIVALSQLSRNVEGRSDKTPMLSDLRESGELEQTADLVGFIHRPEMYSDDEDLKGLAKFIIAKQRNGPTDTVNLAFIAAHTRFENLAMGGQTT